MDTVKNEARHPLLPPTLNEALLADWLKRNAKEVYTDEGRTYFDERQVNEMTRTGSRNGAEMLSLEGILATVKKLVEGGLSEDAGVFKLEIQPTAGTKMLKAERALLDTQVAKGYSTFERNIYGLPNAETAEMLFFTADGALVTERTRQLSARERYDYIGLHDTARLNIEDSQRRTAEG